MVRLSPPAAVAGANAEEPFPLPPHEFQRCSPRKPQHQRVATISPRQTARANRASSKSSTQIRHTGKPHRRCGETRLESRSTRASTMRGAPAARRRRRTTPLHQPGHALLRACCVAFDEFGNVVWPFLDQVMLTVVNDVHLDVGPPVVGSQILRKPRKRRPEDVLAADE
jgi:hypothetical protein